MECLSRVVHRIHSPERQTEQICFFSFRIFGTEYPIPFALMPPPALLSRQSRAWKRHPLEMQPGSGVFFGCGESTYRLGVDTLTRHSSPLGIRLSPLPLTCFI